MVVLPPTQVVHRTGASARVPPSAQRAHFRPSSGGDRPRLWLKSSEGESLRGMLSTHATPTTSGRARLPPLGRRSPSPAEGALQLGRRWLIRRHHLCPNRVPFRSASMPTTPTRWNPSEPRDPFHHLLEFFDAVATTQPAIADARPALEQLEMLRTTWLPLAAREWPVGPQELRELCTLVSTIAHALMSDKERAPNLRYP
jgi:hypothetical protein